MSLIIRESTDADRERWDRYLQSRPRASFYHLFDWRGIVETQFGHRSIYLMALEDDQVVGVLPLTLVSSRYFGRILCSVPYLNYGGPCADSQEIADLLVKDAIERTRELAVDYLELRCAQPLSFDLPLSLKKVSMTIALDRDPQLIWDAFTSKHRNNIRRAAKNGLTVHVGGLELLDEFYGVIERSWRDHGTPLYRRSYFKAILDTFRDRTQIYLCSYKSSAVSVTMNGIFNDVAEGLWAGGLPSARALQANYVLYWEMIRDVCQRGCTHFHLGRSSTDSSSEQFKSRWNAESNQLYWYFYRPDGGPLPALNVDNPRYRLAIAAWQRMPLWLTRRLGPPLARGIP